MFTSLRAGDSLPTQRLTKMGAPPSPTPAPGATICDDLRRVCLSTADCSGLTGSSESELLYDWRFTANQLVLASSPSPFGPRDIASDRPNRKHRFPLFLYCCVTSLSVQTHREHSVTSCYRAVP
jgi:hypothetical protein